jgi:hypothetical protein
MSPVIVNEFELIAAPPSADGDGQPMAAEGLPAEAPPSQSPVLEIERVARRHTERLLRVWAH